MFWLVVTVEIRDKKSRYDWVWRCGGFEKKSWEPSVKKENIEATTEEPRTFSMQGFVHKWKQTQGSSAERGNQREWGDTGDLKEGVDIGANEIKNMGQD